jgi:hypothetical protein
MNINIRHRVVRWTTVVASTLAVSSTLAVAVPQANAAGFATAVPQANAAGLTIVVVPKFATCMNSHGGQVPEGTEQSKVITITAPDGRLIKVTVTVTCGKDGNWH